MHVFLTGAVQVGKSTAISRFLAGCTVDPGGFLTAWTPQGVLELRLLETGEVFQTAQRGQGRIIANTAAFDAAGRRLLGLGSRASLLLMDELGFLEKDAAVFRRAVERLWDSGVPVLGVLRNRPDNVFRPLLEGRADTVILPVSLENRNSIPAQIAAHLGL